MAKDEQYAEVDISDAIDDTEQYADPDKTDTETYEIEIENHTELDSEVLYSEDQAYEDVIQENNTVQTETIQNKSDVTKYTKLPVSRIKHIMKLDPDVNIISNDAAFLVTKACELFLEVMAQETYSVVQKNRKTINKKELDLVINKIDCLCFLEGAMDF